MKAWKINDDGDVSVIVFAEKRSRAKSLALKTEWFCDCEFIDINATRLLEADKYGGDVESILDGAGTRGASIMRELGWYSLDGNYQECRCCGLYEFPYLPDSKLVDFNEYGDKGICIGCRIRNESNLTMSELNNE